MEPSEILGMFPMSTQAAVGMTIYALADRLARLSEEELAGFGVVIAGNATGWMGPDEIPRPTSREEVDRVASALIDRLHSAGLWEAELGQGDGDDPG